MAIKVINISEQPKLIEVLRKDGKHQHNFTPSYLGYTTLICQVTVLQVTMKHIKPSSLYRKPQ